MLNFLQNVQVLLFKNEQKNIMSKINANTYTIDNNLVNFIPFGVDINKFTTLINEKQTNEFLLKLKQTYAQKKAIFIGVERLDYQKSLHLKFRAYDLFLENLVETKGLKRENCLFIQIGVPVKLYANEYVDYAQSVMDQCEQINRKYSTNAVEFINKNVDDLNWLVALYRLSDVCVISAQSDGMNLVAQEYILCQEDKTRPGVLIMSEFTGTASLFKSKFTLNPFDCDLMAQRYHDAIEMSDEERKQMHDDVVNVVKMFSLSKSVRGICESIAY